jgi:hypothetical protein
MNNQRTRTVKSGTAGRLQLSAVLYMCCMARNERYPSIDDSWWPAHKDVGDAVDVRCVYMDDLQCCRIARASQQLARNGTYAKWTRDDGKGYQLNVCVVYSRSPRTLSPIYTSSVYRLKTFAACLSLQFPSRDIYDEPTHGGWDRLLCMDPTNEPT